MKSVISKREKLRACAIYLLTIPPLDELSDEVRYTATEVRSNLINIDGAINYLTETQEEFLSDWIETNEFLDSELGGYKNI